MLLGTLVEVGVSDADPARAEAAIESAFCAIAEVEAQLSRFRGDSDIGRFAALPPGSNLAVGEHTAAVLAAAAELQVASGGLFDVTLHSAPRGWICEGRRLHKLDERAQFDLGGIGKGHAVDCAVAALRAGGCESGWVNAGGDLRAFGETELEILLRDESGGGVRPWLRLGDGALATSCLGPGRRSQVVAAHGADRVAAHVSVAAPRCLWADALTKVVALSGDPAHPALRARGALAWLH